MGMRRKSEREQMQAAADAERVWEAKERKMRAIEYLDHLELRVVDGVPISNETEPKIRKWVDAVKEGRAVLVATACDHCGAALIDLRPFIVNGDGSFGVGCPGCGWQGVAHGCCRVQWKKGDDREDR